MKTFRDEDVEVLEIGKLPFTLSKGKFVIKDITTSRKQKIKSKFKNVSTI